MKKSSHSFRAKSSIVGYTVHHQFFMLAVKYLLVFALIAVVAIFIVDRSVRSKGWDGPVTDHFDGKHFHNIGNVSQGDGGMRGGFWKWILNRPENEWVWRENTTSGTPKERVNGMELSVTMVNHATLLIQTEGLNILTDPMWSYRASPFSFVGPHRYRNPGIRFEDLPPIDAVIVSHNHYDHMDIPTLLRLNGEWNPKILVPLGNKAYLSDRGIANVEEVDWWEKREVKSGITISSVPAQHFSARALSDRNTTLWGGFMIEAPSGKIYFAGDTGYGPFIEKISERWDGVRLALVPIGAFNPRFFMGPVHVDPDEALRLAEHLKAKTVIPMHFGTFHLADDGQDEPMEKLKEAIAARGDTSPTVMALENGASAMIP
jgi:L-ascorbate metabolism protein UlaG (beta-lactamase superfamily)